MSQYTVLLVIRIVLVSQDLTEGATVRDSLTGRITLDPGRDLSGVRRCALQCRVRFFAATAVESTNDLHKGDQV